MKTFLSILTVLATILAIWYAACVPMNIHEAAAQADRAGQQVTPESSAERRKMGRLSLMVKNPHLWGTVYAQERPQLPAPHQVGVELWNTTIGMALNGRALSKRSLILHSWITLSATLVGVRLWHDSRIVLAVASCIRAPWI